MSDVTHAFIGRAQSMRLPAASAVSLIGAAAVGFSMLYLVSDLIELGQGGFSTLQLALTYTSEATIPLFVIGIYAVQRPRIGWLGLLGAVGYAYAFVFFSSTVVYALVDDVPDWNALLDRMGAWMTVHSVLMVASGVALGFAVRRARASGLDWHPADRGHVRDGRRRRSSRRLPGCGRSCSRHRLCRNGRVVARICPDRLARRARLAATSRHRGGTMTPSEGDGAHVQAGAAVRDKRVVRGLADVLAASPLFLFAPLYRPWHLRWGATESEVTGPMPGDELIADPSVNATRAITIDAPPEDVWPWIVQVGYGRAGWYSYDLFDNAARPSAEQILPEYQHPKVGDWVPMAAKVNETTAFKIKAFEPNAWMLWEKRHSTWAWRLSSRDDQRTRLVVRLREVYAWHTPGSALLTLILFEFGDFPMMRRQLRGIRRRAEAETVRQRRER